MGTSVNNTESRSLLLRQRQEGIRQDASANQNAVQQNSSDQQSNGQAVQTNSQAQQGNASDVQTTTGNIQTTSQSIDAANAKKSGVNSEISNLQSQLQSAQDNPDRAASIQNDISAAEMSLSSIESEIQQLETQKGQQEQELAGLEQTGTQLKSEGQTLEQEGATLQQTGAELAQIGADLDAQIAELDAQIAQAEAEEVQAQQAETTESEAEPEQEQVTTDVPVQNNKGWEYYARLELEAEHAGEEGYKPSNADLNARAGEIRQRNIENGNVGKKGDLRVGTPQNPKYVTLNGEIDASGLQTTEQALDKYNEGQEIIAEQKAKAEAAAAEKAEAAAKAKAAEEAEEAEEAQVKSDPKTEAKVKAEVEEGLKNEISKWSKEELNHAMNAEDYSDDDINKAIDTILSDGSMLETLKDMADAGGQDMGKFLGQLAKKHGCKNAQKIVGRMFNTIANGAGKVPGLKVAGKKIPGVSIAYGGYGIYQAVNGDITGLCKVADAAIGFIPVMGPVLSFIGTENIAKAKAYHDEDFKNGTQQRLGRANISMHMRF